MSKTNDGGPAFPGEQGHTEEHGWNQTWNPGMSLRDYLAAHVSAKEIDDHVGDTIEEVSRFLGIDPAEYRPRTHWPMANAKARYAIADAMIAARGGK